MAKMTYIEAGRRALAEEMRRDPLVWAVGEDLGRGGVFGQYKGLADEFGSDRISDAPISESCIMGAAVGAIVAGLNWQAIRWLTEQVTGGAVRRKGRLMILATLAVLLGGLHVGEMVGHDQLQVYLGDRDVTVILHSSTQAKYYELIVGLDDLSYRSGGYQCAR